MSTCESSTVADGVTCCFTHSQCQQRQDGCNSEEHMCAVTYVEHGLPAILMPNLRVSPSFDVTGTVAQAIDKVHVRAQVCARTPCAYVLFTWS